MMKWIKHAEQAEAKLKAVVDLAERSHSKTLRVVDILAAAQEKP